MGRIIKRGEVTLWRETMTRERGSRHGLTAGDPVRFSRGLAKLEVTRDWWLSQGHPSSIIVSVEVDY